MVHNWRVAAHARTRCTGMWLAPLEIFALRAMSRRARARHVRLLLRQVDTAPCVQREP